MKLTAKFQGEFIVDLLSFDALDKPEIDIGC